MQSTAENLESVIAKATEFAETKIELWKLKTADKLSQTVSSLLSKIAIIILAGISLLILSLGAAFWIGDAMDNLYYGFFIVGGVYALAGLLVYIFRASLIKRPISNLIIDKIVK